MSQQKPNEILFQGETYAIIAASTHEGLFDPKQFGITTVMLHTAAHRGFISYYSVMDNTLLLSALEICAKGGLYPLINGTPPSFPHGVSEGFDSPATYNEIGLHVPYTGTLHIGRDMDAKHKRRFFSVPDWMYLKVLDLEFVDGRVKSVADLSEKMAEIREKQPTAEERMAEEILVNPIPKKTSQ